jgi:hypothetical protein
MKLDTLSAMHFIREAWRLLRRTTIKNYFVMCHFSTDHANSNDDSAVYFNEDDDWHSLQLLGVQSKDSYMWQCSWGLRNPECQPGIRLTQTGEEVSEHKATFLDALKGTESARSVSIWYRAQYYCNVQQSWIQTEGPRKEKQNSLIKWLKKWCN